MVGERFRYDQGASLGWGYRHIAWWQMGVVKAAENELEGQGSQARQVERVTGPREDYF